MNMKNLWMTGVAVAALFPTAAVAQQAAIAQQTVTPDPNGAGQDARAQNDQGLADIIVTANKQATDLQKTSGAIATVSGDAIVALGIINTQALSKLVSGLWIEPSGALFIRGIGSRSIAATADPAVAFNVDGVYYSRVSGTSATLFDISRIEVLKGPQGTLYGRNATGGVVNVITKHPLLGARTLDGQIEVGDYNDVRTNVAVNLPLGESAAFRLAAQTSYNSGYLSDGGDDEDTKALRASVLFRPSGFSLYLSGDYAHVGGQGPEAVATGPGGNGNTLTTRFVDPSNPWAGLNSPASQAFIARASPPTALPASVVSAAGLPAGTYCAATLPGPPGAPVPVPANPVGVPANLSCSYTNGYPTNNPLGYRDNDYYGFNGTVDVDAGIGTLTAIGGYRGSRIQSLGRTQPSYSITNNKVDQFSGEVRLASKPNSGPLKWIVGGFYLREKQDSVFTISNANLVQSNPSGAAPLPRTTCVAPLTATTCIAPVTITKAFTVTDDPNIVNESYAGFGEATLSLFDRLRLIGGLRYTSETKSETGGSIVTIYSLPAGVTTSTPTANSVTFHKLNYRAGVEFDIAPRSMFYASLSTAYHAGGFNPGVAQGPNPYVILPEDAKSYTVGVKNRFFDNKLQFNIEGFWVDYTNYQQNGVGRFNDGTAACTANANNCPVTLITTNAAAARSRGVEADIVFAPMRNTTLNLNVLYNDAEYTKFRQESPAGVTVIDGRRLAGTVPWTVTGSVNQIIPLENGGKIIANVQSQYKAGAYLYFLYAAGTYQKGYTRTDLNLTYELPGGRASIGGFVRNLEDKATLVSGLPTDPTTGAVYNAINPPRTYGAILGFHF